MNLGAYVRRQPGLVVQPRMGLADPRAMRAGLRATRDAAAITAGTITLDSYTRVGDLAAIEYAMREGIALNGYPIVSHSPEVTRAVVDGIGGDDFPVQVRHGSARPQAIFRAVNAAGLRATEGGPISYCLPYGRTPLAESVANWAECCAILLDGGPGAHLETFGGCLLGQLCPPSQLVAVSVLEALYFHRHGLRSISLSYAQQTNADQDVEAVYALRRLTAQLLPDADTHTVIYTYMGLAPRTAGGVEALLTRAVEIAAGTGAERLIVKTAAEAHRIPTVAENIAALEHAAAQAAARYGTVADDPGEGQIYQEAYAMIDAVLNADADLGRAIVTAFRRGLLDVPYCLHPDNAGRSRSYLDADGRLRWAELGSLPIRAVAERTRAQAVSSAEFLESLSYVQRSFDAPALGRSTPAALALPEVNR